MKIKCNTVDAGSLGRLAVALALLLLGLAAVQNAPAQQAQEPKPQAAEQPAQPGDVAMAATVNDVGIPRVLLDRSVDAFLRQQGLGNQVTSDQEEYRRIRERVLDILISQELLWQEAERKGIVASQADVEAALQQIRSGMPSEEVYLQRIGEAGFTAESFAANVKHQLSARRFIESEIAASVEVSKSEIHDFYEANRAGMVSPEQVHARHILIKLDPTADEATRTAARKRIDEVLEKARGENADFSALAKEHSEGPSGAQGGDLGFFTREQMVKPFADAAFALEPGQVSEVVQSQFGYHVIKLEERREARQITEDEVADRIRERLLAAKRQQAVEDFVQNLRSSSDVEVLPAP